MTSEREPKVIHILRFIFGLISVYLNQRSAKVNLKIILKNMTIITATRLKQRERVTHSVRMACSNCDYSKDNIEILNPGRITELLKTVHCPKCKKFTLMQNRTIRIN